MKYDYLKKFSLYWVKDPTAIDRNKKRPMAILWKQNGQYILVKITTKYKDYNKYCYTLNEWFEAGLNRPSCIRLDKFVNCDINSLNKRDYIGYLGELDILAIQSMLDSLYR